MTHSFTTADARGQWFAVTSAADVDEAQVTGEWIKTTDPVKLRP